MNVKRRVVMLVSISVLLMSCGFALSADKSVIVGFHRKPGPSEKALIHEAKGLVRRSYHLIPAMSVRIPENAIAQLRKNEKVAYVEEDGIFMAVEPLPGNEYAETWGVRHIGSEVAHTSGNKGAGVKVAVIDTGIDYTHEDLDDNYRGGTDIVFGDGDPYDDSWNSHGTHVGGVIAAEDNGIGVIGVAPEAELYAVKVLDGGGFGLLSWIIAGLEWAVNNHMNIANLSIQGPDFQSLHDACDAAYEAGIVVVAAGGNSYGGEVKYPAAYDSVVAVTATDPLDATVYFAPVGTQLEMAAPGMDIMSTVAGGGYEALSGTSQAAPHISGTAALFFTSALQDVNGDGDIDCKDVRHMLQTTAVDLGVQGKDPVFGFGLVDAAEAAMPGNEPMMFSLVRTRAFPVKDVETVSLSGGLYDITIENNGLAGVRVDVFANGVYQKALSSKYRFQQRRRIVNKNALRHGKGETAAFYINAAVLDYDVMFTPVGKPGTSANITINMQGE